MLDGAHFSSTIKCRYLKYGGKELGRFCVMPQFQLRRKELQMLHACFNVPAAYGSDMYTPR